MGLLSALKPLSVLAYICVSFVVVEANKKNGIPELPYCNPDSESPNDGLGLIYASTLDGKLSALNVDGSLAWSIETGPGPLLSSSIHARELSNNGHWIRLIPSLSGGLYKFNGESLEAVPISADHLLQTSSFIFSDDVLIAGGKESRTYGVEVKTGKLLYECSMKGCTNYTDGNAYSQDVVVVQRQTQTVRAIEARSGEEKWNFSVGQHDLKYMRESGADCRGSTENGRTDQPYDLKVIVPEGLICAVSKAKPEKIIWKHKFLSPIVTAWVTKGEKLETIDLFSGTQWSSPYSDDNGLLSPTLYVGMHKMQLYVQESVTMQKKVGKIGNFIAEDSDHPRIPWKPIPATANLLGISASSSNDETALQTFDSSATAISVLYGSEYVNGNGYYLFSEEEEKRSQQLQCSAEAKDNGTIALEEIELEQNTTVHIITVSLWYWWKEVMVISLSTAFLLNLLLRHRFPQYMRHPPQKDKLQQDSTFTKFGPDGQEHDSGVDVHLATRSNSDPGKMGDRYPNFTSRYLTDFHHIQCLGRGGFGVVFEAKNKIDDCNYAIKRIALPNNQESRERVMREVKALAKLEHHHIVRYFNAWVECPPAGWQEQHDRIYAKQRLEDATSIDLSHISSDNSTKRHNEGGVSNLELSNDKPDLSERSFNLSKQQDLFVEDSFIVFENSQKSDSEEDSLIVFQEPSRSEAGQGDAKLRHSVISLGSESESAHSECQALAQRPASLEIRADGSVVPRHPTPIFLYIQMQLCQRESLREWLKTNDRTRVLQDVLTMFRQIVEAVEYVHMQGLIHRDLKPSNIFFAMNGQIKVGDFGLVIAMAESNPDQRTPCDECDSQSGKNIRHTAQVGTEIYMSPEQLGGLPYDYKVDIYSLGLILFELLVPFSTQMERHKTLTELRQNKFPSHFQDKFQDEYKLLHLMLSHDPKKRPTTYGIRACPPLSQFYEGKWGDRGDGLGQNIWHFELPSRKKTASFSNSSSMDSWDPS